MTALSPMIVAPRYLDERRLWVIFCCSFEAPAVGYMRDSWHSLNANSAPEAEIKSDPAPVTLVAWHDKGVSADVSHYISGRTCGLILFSHDARLSRFRSQFPVRWTQGGVNDLHLIKEMTRTSAKTDGE